MYLLCRTEWEVFSQVKIVYRTEEGMIWPCNASLQDMSRRIKLCCSTMYLVVLPKLECIAYEQIYFDRLDKTGTARPCWSLAMSQESIHSLQEALVLGRPQICHRERETSAVFLSVLSVSKDPSQSLCKVW